MAKDETDGGDEGGRNAGGMNLEATAEEYRDLAGIEKGHVDTDGQDIADKAAERAVAEQDEGKEQAAKQDSPKTAKKTAKRT